jgi:hypothetical protein
MGSALNLCSSPRKALMLQGYFDDSGSDEKKSPSSFVLAGWILPAESWACFSDDWQRELAGDPKISYFKMSEAVSATGNFSVIQSEFRKYKIRKMLEIINKHPLHGICSFLKWQEWLDYARPLPPPLNKEPYAPLFFLLIDNVLLYQKNLGMYPQEIQLDFDNQGKSGHFAIEWFNRLWDGVERWRFSDEHKKIIEATPRMLNSKEHMPIQAADMLAWSIRTHLDSPNSDWEWVYEEMKPSLWGGRGFSAATWKTIRDQP